MYYINNIDLIDNNINNNSLSYLNDESLIEEKEEEDDVILEDIDQKDAKSDIKIKKFWRRRRKKLW